VTLPSSLNILLGALAVPAACGGEPAATPASAPEPPVEVRAAVDKAVATTGDLLTYEVVVEHDEGIEVAVPEAGAEIAGFRIVDLGTDLPVKKGGRVIERRWYSLRADLVGSYVLPPVSVTYNAPSPTTLTTSEIFVEVASVLPADGTATDIRDIKPLEPVAADLPWLWMAVGAGALVLAGGTVGAAWLRRRRRRARAPRVVPPHEIAFAALSELRQTDFEDTAAMRRYYFRVSEVVRAYVEGRFALNATDLTREEILTRLADLSDLEPSPREKLTRFLDHTDQVKFANREPTTAEIGETYERALSFVEETMLVPAAVEAGSAAGNAAGGARGGAADGARHDDSAATTAGDGR